MKQATDIKCRMCYKADDHVKYTNVTVCTLLVPSEYNNRHNQVTGQIHWTIRKRMELQVTDKCNEHIPERVKNINCTAIMWDVPAVTDRKILANRHHLVLRDK